jgi:hypothetical protein
MEPVYWPQGVVTEAGTVIGGYFGERYAMKLPPHWVRASVILVGTGDDGVLLRGRIRSEACCDLAGDFSRIAVLQE